MIKFWNYLKLVITSIKNFIQFDSILHFLACAIIIFTFFPLVDNVGNAVIIATVVALAKEYLDMLILRSNTWKQSLKDILFDALGVIYAVLFITLLY
jgi:hypothetical protein